MKNYLFPFIILFVLTACTEKVEERPAFVLSEDSMVMLMIDVHLLEAAVAEKHLPRDSSLLVYNLYKNDLFQKHHITDSVYTENFNYYATHPSYMLKVYERVVDSLSWREERRHGGEQRVPIELKETDTLKVPVNRAQSEMTKQRIEREKRKLEDWKKKRSNK